MKWLRRWIEASKDQDKFWADWHRARWEKSLAHYEAKRRKHLQLAFGAGRMAQYYMDRICGAPRKP